MAAKTAQKNTKSAENVSGNSWQGLTLTCSALLLTTRHLSGLTISWLLLTKIMTFLLVYRIWGIFVMASFMPKFCSSALGVHANSCDVTLGKETFPELFWPLKQFLTDKKSMTLKYRIQRSVINRGYSWGCPAHSFTGFSFTIAVYEKNALWAAWDFLLQYHEWPLGKIGLPAERRRRIQVL